MSLDKRREALRRAAFGLSNSEPQADLKKPNPGVRRISSGKRPGEIAPADIVTWSGPAETTTEWLVVSWSADGGQLVPVDDAPLRGSRDLDLSRAAGEPLFARCGQATWISAQASLQAVWRLPPGEAHRALDAVAGCLDALEEGDPPELEIDSSDLYREHRESVEAARAFLQNASTDTWPASVTSMDSHRDTSSRNMPLQHWSTLLAAGFALVALGLGFQTMKLSRQLGQTQAELEIARFVAFGEAEQQSLSLDTVRSGGQKVVRTQADAFLLHVSFSSIESYPAYEARWINRETEALLHTQSLGELDADFDSVSLVLPVADGYFDLVLLGLGADGTAEELRSGTVRIITDSDGPGS